MTIFIKLSSSLVISSWNLTLSGDKSSRNRNISNFFYGYSSEAHFPTNSAKITKFDAGNLILLQIKVFTRNIKETTLKVTAFPSFTQLRVIRRVNRVH